MLSIIIQTTYDLDKALNGQSQKNHLLRLKSRSAAGIPSQLFPGEPL